MGLDQTKISPLESPVTKLPSGAVMEQRTAAGLCRGWKMAVFLVNETSSWLDFASRFQKADRQDGHEKCDKHDRKNRQG